MQQQQQRTPNVRPEEGKVYLDHTPTTVSIDLQLNEKTI